MISDPRLEAHEPPDAEKRAEEGSITGSVTTLHRDLRNSSTEDHERVLATRRGSAETVRDGPAGWNETLRTHQLAARRTPCEQLGASLQCTRPMTLLSAIGPDLRRCATSEPRAGQTREARTRIRSVVRRIRIWAFPACSGHRPVG